MIFKEVNGFEADLTFSDLENKWVGKVLSWGPFWSVPWRNPDKPLTNDMDIEFIQGPYGDWVISDSNLPWFILYPEKGTIDHYR